MRKLDLLAWAVLVGLGIISVLAVARLGFIGLVILGLAVLLVCTRATLNDDVPTWGEAVFRARMQTPRQPKLALGFYRACGAFLLTVGALGLAWTWWH